MKKTTFILLIVSFIINISSCSKHDYFFGDDIVTSENRELAAFNKISSEGVFQVNIIQGTQQSVEVIANSNIIDRLVTSVSNGRLKIYLLEGNYQNISVEINITVTDLQEIINTGTGNIFISNFHCSTDLKIENSGSGNINISGSSDSLNLYNEGSGNFYGFEFLTNNTDITIEGSSNCEVNCADSLDVVIEGSGNVYYKGSPSITSQIIGSGEIIQMN